MLKRFPICPAGLPDPPWAAGCRGDAFLRGADERGDGRRRPSRPVETAGQLCHGAQQRGGQLRAEVSMKGRERLQLVVSGRLTPCLFCCSGTWTSWCAWEQQPKRREVNIWPGMTSRPASTKSTWPSRRSTNVRDEPLNSSTKQQLCAHKTLNSCLLI